TNRGYLLEQDGFISVWVFQNGNHALRYGKKGFGILMDGKFDFGADPFLQAPQRGGATGHVDTIGVDVASKLRRTFLQSLKNGLFYFHDRMIQGISNFGIADFYSPRNAADRVFADHRKRRRRIQEGF